MPQAVTHFLIPVILLELFRDFFVKDKKHFPAHYVFIGGLAGLLPDLDVAVYYILSFFGFTMQEVHRTFSHNLFVPLFFVILSLIFYSFKNKKLGEHHLKLRNIFLVIAFGIFIHLLLDTLISGGIKPFYPISNFSIGLNLINIFPFSWRESIIPSLDAILLILWMIYLEVKHKISSFL
ncbi:MAG: metal-dependent hydrolase [Nanoarchaeota archaeon]|nr:metal-dependent hydrolase [Nanoarchaeota archaeon]